jgi:hypothetical protein
MPTTPALVLPMYRIDAADDVDPFGASPFTITRYGVTWLPRDV